MKMIKKIAHWLYLFYAYTTFIIGILLLSPLVLISKIFGEKGNDFVYQLCSVFVKFWYGCIGIKPCYIFPENAIKKEQTIFIANHISYLDIPNIFLAIPQPIRIVGKYEMIKIPVFSWVYTSVVVLVKRKTMGQKALVYKKIEEKIKQGYSIFIFPEGTFNETDQTLKFFYDGAFRVALKFHLPIQPILFIDTVHRLHYNSIFSLTCGQTRILYLPAIDAKKYAPTAAKILRENIFEAMKTSLERYNYKKK